MRFSKMQGAGNDFILINGFVEKSDNWNEVAKKVCDRHFGVGADGMIFCSESTIADVKMNFYNADGSRAEMCGNGIRCFAKFVYDNNIVRKEEIKIETDAGIKVVKLEFDENGEVENLVVKLSKVDFNSNAVPCTIKKEQILDEEIEIDGMKIKISSVLMGVPHTVIFVENFEKYDINRLGKMIENASIFPRKTNVNFLRKIDDTTFEIKTWERGAGRTLGCGTGSSASVAVAKKLGIVDGKRVSTISEGGELIVEVDENYEVTLIGKVETICEGKLRI